MNMVRTGVLLAAMTALFMVAGYALGGVTGLVLALVFSFSTNAYAFWNSDKLALSAHNARPATKMSHPELVAAVERLAAKAGLPTPAVYVIDRRQPNAFATGRDPKNAAVAVTHGLLNNLWREHIDAVIAHELAHIKNRDTLTMTIAATFAGAITVLANIGFLMGGNRNDGRFGFVGVLIAAFLAPTAAALIEMTISRTREFAADRTAAEITGKPLALAGALQRIADRTPWNKMASAETHPATAHMFIVNPLVGLRLDRLFATHPPTEHRIAALEAMAHQRGYVPPPGPVQQILKRSTSIPRVRRK